MKKKTILTGLLAALVLTCLTLGKSVLADTGLYRLYHPGLQVHLYTTDTNEYKVLGAAAGSRKAWLGTPQTSREMRSTASITQGSASTSTPRTPMNTRSWLLGAGNRKVLPTVPTEPCPSTASTTQA